MGYARLRGFAFPSFVRRFASAQVCAGYVCHGSAVLARQQCSRSGWPLGTTVLMVVVLVSFMRRVSVAHFLMSTWVLWGRPPPELSGPVVCHGPTLLGAVPGGGTLIQWEGLGAPFRFVFPSSDAVRSRQLRSRYHSAVPGIAGECAASECMLGSALYVSVYFTPAPSAAPRAPLDEGPCHGMTSVWVARRLATLWAQRTSPRTPKFRPLILLLPLAFRGCPRSTSPVCRRSSVPGFAR